MPIAPRLRSTLHRAGAGPSGPALLVVASCILLGVFAGAAAPVALAAQEPGSTEALLTERELEYRAARSAHQSALDAREAARQRFERSLQESARARRSENETELGRALARAQAESLSLASLDRRTDETATRLREAGEALARVLNQHIEELFTQLEATAGAERNRIAAIISERRNQLREVESAVLEPPAPVVAVPELVMDPRDGPTELRAKLQLLERRIEQLEGQVEAIDSRIGELEARIRRERGLGDLLSGIRRYDDDRVPVGPPGDARRDEEIEGATPADSTQARPLTPAEEIEQLRVLRGEVEAIIQQLEIRARVFRREVERWG